MKIVTQHALWGIPCLIWVHSPLVCYTDITKTLKALGDPMPYLGSLTPGSLYYTDINKNQENCQPPCRVHAVQLTCFLFERFFKIEVLNLSWKLPTHAAIHTRKQLSLLDWAHLFCRTGKGFAPEHVVRESHVSWRTSLRRESD